ncbi:uncharacterized protein LOC131219923 [Magnolia sinica]|uniref:uncharacterized protein LOC131219923 n=1 Tax=Magnolia sinica TaxID=86752 RepID=UPI002659CEBC|nr:uncharacterized protein LOC131219923 [Magnolia sinica]
MTSVSNQMLTLSFAPPTRCDPVSQSVVYVKCCKFQRRVLWSEIENLGRSVQGAWAIAGDFNAVINPDERRGSRAVDGTSMEDFAEMIHNSGLIDAGFIDHAPLRLIFPSQDSPKVRPFKFLRMWTMHASFYQLIQRAWAGECSPHSMINVQLKLKKTKQVLKVWNKEMFGNIFCQIQIAEEELEGIDFSMQSAPFEDLSHQFIEREIKTQNFRSSANERAKRATISSIRNAVGESISSSREIKAKAVKFFEDLFQVEPISFDADFLQAIPQVITQLDNDSLLAPPLMEEVKAVAFSMPRDGAAGPNGFSAAFYATCWDIISDDILKASRDLMDGIAISRAFTLNLICLIPKSPSTACFADFRPISLCNFAMRRGCPSSSHLLFADDILLFTNARIRSTEHTLGFQKAREEIIYLGAPLCTGRIKSSAFQFLVDKVDRRTSGWAGRLISQASRVTLVRHVLSSLPIHIMLAMHIPRQVIDKMERSFSNFFWGWADENRKLHWLAWKKIARPIEEGGLGIRRLRDVMEAHCFKLVWTVKYGDPSSPSANLMKSKHVRDIHAIAQVPSSSNLSPLWKKVRSLFPILSESIQWTVGNGDLNFWSDN